jgi:hypothetical protein
LTAVLGLIKMVDLAEQPLSVCTVGYIVKRRFVTAGCKELVGRFAFLSSIRCEGLLQRNIGKQPEETRIPEII